MFFFLITFLQSCVEAFIILNLRSVFNHIFYSCVETFKYTCSKMCFCHVFDHCGVYFILFFVFFKQGLCHHNYINTLAWTGPFHQVFEKGPNLVFDGRRGERLHFYDCLPLLLPRLSENDKGRTKNVVA